jgi:hypothetical protein
MELYQIGPRWAGTEGESKAKSYIFDKLQESGLNDVHLEEFEYLNCMPVSSGVNVISPKGITLSSESLAYSANRTEEGELIYVGEGTEEDFRTLENLWIDFKDKIVMVKTEAPFFTYPLVEKRGSKGMICTTDTFRHNDMMFHGTSKFPIDMNKATEEQKGTIPGVTILLKDAETLLSLLSTGKVTIQVKQQANYSPKKSWNIIGSIRGVEQPEQKVVIGGHYDSMWNVPGAWDNAAGCAGIVELARVMANLKPRRSIMFCVFGCEETGCCGSSSYVKTHRDELDKYVSYIQIEPGGAYPSRSLWTTPKIMDFALATTKNEFGWHVDESLDITQLGPVGDYEPFVKTGVEAIWIHDREMNPYYHTERDTIEYIDPEKLHGYVSVSGLYAFKLAYTPTLPWQV